MGGGAGAGRAWWGRAPQLVMTKPASASARRLPQRRTARMEAACPNISMSAMRLRLRFMLRFTCQREPVLLEFT
jgi:hypothetical protein